VRSFKLAPCQQHRLLPVLNHIRPAEQGSKSCTLESYIGLKCIYYTLKTVPKNRILFMWPASTISRLILGNKWHISWRVVWLSRSQMLRHFLLMNNVDSFIWYFFAYNSVFALFQFSLLSQFFCQPLLYWLHWSAVCLFSSVWVSCVTGTWLEFHNSATLKMQQYLLAFGRWRHMARFWV